MCDGSVTVYYERDGGSQRYAPPRSGGPSGWGETVAAFEQLYPEAGEPASGSASTDSSCGSEAYARASGRPRLGPTAATCRTSTSSRASGGPQNVDRKEETCRGANRRGDGLREETVRAALAASQPRLLFGNRLRPVDVAAVVTATPRRDLVCSPSRIVTTV